MATLRSAESSGQVISRLVVDQVVSSWLALYFAEMGDAAASPQSLGWAEFQLKRLEAAHRRHLKSISALATLQHFLPQGREEADGAISGESSHTEREQVPLSSVVAVRNEETSRFQLCPS